MSVASPLPLRVLHLMQGVGVGGMEKGVLQQVRLAREARHNDGLLLFDSPAGDPSRDYDVAAIPCHFLPRRPGFDWRFVVRLRQYLQQRSPRILHAHNDTALCYAALALWASAEPSPRLLATFHNYPAHPTRSSRQLSRWAAARCAAVTAVSHELAARLRDDHWASAVEVVVNGIDTEQFEPAGPSEDLRAQLGCGDDTLLVGHIGRFDDNKRQADLVAAVQLIVPTSLDVRLLMVGQGPTQSGVQALSAGDARISWTPRVADVAAWLRALDVFVLCSLHEGISRALLEAMACARAVVATAVGGSTRLLADDRDGACGLLVPSRSPAALAAAIDMLGASPRLRHEMGQRARRRVQAFHTAQATTNAYEALMAPFL